MTQTTLKCHASAVEEWRRSGGEEPTTTPARDEREVWEGEREREREEGETKVGRREAGEPFNQPELRTREKDARAQEKDGHR
jgi:hypothetical protein